MPLTIKITASCVIEVESEAELEALHAADGEEAFEQLIDAGQSDNCEFRIVCEEQETIIDAEEYEDEDEDEEDEEDVEYDEDKEHRKL